MPRQQITTLPPETRSQYDMATTYRFIIAEPVKTTAEQVTSRDFRLRNPPELTKLP
jgi:hypothetical protein